MGDVTILVTGFSAFPGAPVNPSAAIVMRLLRRHARRLRLHGIRLATAVLPVVYDAVTGELEELVARTRPDAIVHLGLASRRKQVSVEARAVNRVTTLHPDAAKRRAAARAVRAGGLPVLCSPLATPPLVTLMHRTGVPVQLSLDAGDYVCNQTLYASLASGGAPAVFIHVPRLTGKRHEPDDDAAAAITLPALTRAVEAGLVAIAIRVRRMRREVHRAL
ncbi:MAG: pyroglutamyl-peptidase [Methylobacteriaceae bacterium]|jgi:pyroglutamyl-peptidase|nr:pyroglutamyl-peptidase [Methylobacteriaceae bacterium]